MVGFFLALGLLLVHGDAVVLLDEPVNGLPLRQAVGLPYLALFAANANPAQAKGDI